MKRYRKTSAIVAACLTLALALAGCSGGSEQTKPSPTPTPAPEYTAGTLTETSFESAYLDMKWQLPQDSSALMLSEAEVQAFENEMNAQTQTNNTTVEMMAFAPDESLSVIVMAELPAISGLTLEQYAQVIETQTLANEFYSLRAESETMTLAGKDTIKVSFALENGRYQDYYMMKVHDRFVTILVTYVEQTEGQAEDAVNAFQALS